jgi:putative ABC transport system permease protein
VTRSESRFPGLRRVVRLPGRSIQADVDEELAFHIESRVHELVRQGTSASGARRIAEAEFGDVRASRRELAAVDRHRRRRERIAHVIESIAQDGRYAVRALLRTPAFTVAAAGTLIVGLAATISIFAVVNGILLRPLPFEDPDRLVGIWHDLPRFGMNHVPQAPQLYFTYQSEARAIAGMGMFRERATNVDDPNGSAAPSRLSTGFFTATMFSVLGVHPALGRWFTDDEDRPGGRPVVVISYGMWRAQFGSDPSIIGRPLDVDGIRREIVGVMPPSFRFPSAQTDLWIPLAMNRVSPPPSAYGYYSVARLKPGVSVVDAQRDLAVVLPRVAERYATFVPGITMRMMLDQLRPKPVLTSFRDDITGGIAGTIWMLAAAGLLLLCVACVNVANLVLVRCDARQREFAVREALGASRFRQMRQIASESVMLAAVSGVLALGTAWLAIRTFVAHGPEEIPRLPEVSVDAATLWFALAVTSFATIVCTLLPALRLGRARMSTSPSSSTRGGTADRAQHRVRGVLVGTQIAFSLVMLAGSGLLLRSFERLHSVRLGFDAEHVATVWIALPRANYDRDSDVVRFMANALNGIGHLAGVSSVGVTSRLPLVARGVNQNPVYPEGASTYDTKLPPLQILTSVGGDYFRTMRIPLIAGRLFDGMEHQRDGDAIISRRTALMFWGDSTGAAAVGKRFRTLPTDPWYTVTGVVGDTRDTTLAAAPSPTVYFPEAVPRNSAAVAPSRVMAIVARTIGEPASTVADMRRIIRELDPRLPTFGAESMSDVMRASTARLAFVMLVLAVAAAVSLVLGAIGLYGVMAYAVTLRRREIGIRLALGAAPPRIVLATTRQGLALASIGVAVGLALFGAATRLMRALVFEVSAWDPATLGAAIAILLMAAALASWLPARRAANVNPAETLRAD